MAPFQRRTFLSTAAAALAAPATLRAQAQARLLVIGGGFGGASAANFARRTYPWLDVTLVEPQPRLVTCPYGNLVIAGEREIRDITHGYDGLRARGVRVVHDWAEGIDPVARQVRLRHGDALPYDRLILSPGIALRFGAIEGYDEEASGIMPHAWIAGDGSQMLLLRRQLEAMPDGASSASPFPPIPSAARPVPMSGSA